MREILFKAKRIDNGEWVEGYLYRLSEQHNPFIMLKNKCGLGYEVDVNTVCQYTDLKDKNGNKIWENDIVRCEFLKGVLKIIWCSSDSGWFAKSTHDVEYGLGYDNYYETIGNIFDNPELLEK